MGYTNFNIELKTRHINKLLNKQRIYSSQQLNYEVLSWM